MSGSTKGASGNAKAASGRNAGKKKRSFKEEREYAELPGRIAALETEQHELQAKLADTEFYRQGATVIQHAVDRLEKIQHELLAAIDRWDVLDSIGQ